jgi:hypothetical protein
LTLHHQGPRDCDYRYRDRDASVIGHAFRERPYGAAGSQRLTPVVAGGATTCPDSRIGHASQGSRCCKAPTGFAVTTLHRVVSDRRCRQGVRWRLCHSASTSSCSSHPLTTLFREAEGSCREDQVQLGRPIGCGSIGRPTAGCQPRRLPLHQGTAISGTGTVSPAGDRRVRRAHSGVDDTETTINTTGADDWYAVRRASGDAVRATSTATSPERTCTPGSHSASADGYCAIS